ncbi:restriction endonuclease [Geomonas oryzisoli]|uniref:Restriction endonuclease n=1 Tax=Geomonas oryzisoli TaxID=2847992 RepID=A0ABX8JAS2_9BACT|nr:restriction endonuclease [Geomonas oryzisoli]QWV94888.1 restriction endonuclease [Geomonas oryzisoli]
MDAFEVLVASIFERDGFWVRPSFKVELTKEEKCAIRRPSSPRWELDLIAYKAGTNELRIIECKSYLDSRGVGINAFIGSNEKLKSRFKIFNEQYLCEVVVQRLITQLLGTKSILADPKIIICLAVGKFSSDKDKIAVKELFNHKGWELLDNEWLCRRLKLIAKGSYQNEVLDVVAKILIRTKINRVI